MQTEQTMNELQFATGLDPIDDAAPSIIPRGPVVQPAAPQPSRLRRLATEPARPTMEFTTSDAGLAAQVGGGVALALGHENPGVSTDLPSG